MNCNSGFTAVKNILAKANETEFQSTFQLPETHQIAIARHRLTGRLSDYTIILATFKPYDFK